MSEEREPVNADTEYDLLFPVVPSPNDTQAPDLASLALVDDLVEFAEERVPNEGVSADVAPRALKALAIDWQTGELACGSTGSPLIVEREDTVIEWAMTVMNIPAGVYPIFEETFGNRTRDLPGLPQSVAFAEVARMIVEMYSPLPWITAVDVLDVRRIPALDPAAMFVTVSLDTVFSDEPLQLDLHA